MSYNACCDLHDTLLIWHDKLKTGLGISVLKQRPSRAAVMYTPAELTGDRDDTGDGGEAGVAPEVDGPCAGEAAGALPL